MTYIPVNFREANTILFNLLSSKSTYKVEFGKFGKFPMDAPSIVIFSKPASNEVEGKEINYLLKYYDIAKFTIFALDYVKEDMVESIANTIDMLENILDIITKNATFQYIIPEGAISFDDAYDNNLVVSYFEFYIPYKRKYQV